MTQDAIKTIERALQGLSFWIGYRSLLHYYPLTEGAIVSELCVLLQSTLPSSYAIKSEYHYELLTGEPSTANTGRKPSADIVIGERPGRGEFTPLLVIEVKRLPGKGEVEKDIEKISKAMELANLQWRGIVVAVGQGIISMPRKWRRKSKATGKIGITASRARQSTGRSTDAPYQVRRILRASSTVNPRQSNVVVVLEVMPQ